VPVADVDSFATFTSGQRKPRPRGWFRTGQVLGGPSSLMRERRAGGILPPVATNCLPGTGLRITLGAFCLWNTRNLEMFWFRKKRPQRRGNAEAASVDGLSARPIISRMPPICPAAALPKRAFNRAAPRGVARSASRCQQFWWGDFDVAHLLFVAVRRPHTEREGFRHARNVAAE
jgi:hypothetical protein